MCAFDSSEMESKLIISEKGQWFGGQHLPHLGFRRQETLVGREDRQCVWAHRPCLPRVSVVGQGEGSAGLPLNAEADVKCPAHGCAVPTTSGAADPAPPPDNQNTPGPLSVAAAAALCSFREPFRTRARRGKMTEALLGALSKIP